MLQLLVAEVLSRLSNNSGMLSVKGQGLVVMRAIRVLLDGILCYGNQNHLFSALFNTALAVPFGVQAQGETCVDCFKDIVCSCIASLSHTMMNYVHMVRRRDRSSRAGWIGIALLILTPDMSSECQRQLHQPSLRTDACALPARLLLTLFSHCKAGLQRATAAAGPASLHRGSWHRGQ